MTLNYEKLKWVSLSAIVKLLSLSHDICSESINIYLSSLKLYHTVPTTLTSFHRLALVLAYHTLSFFLLSTFINLMAFAYSAYHPPG